MRQLAVLLGGFALVLTACGTAGGQPGATPAPAQTVLPVDWTPEPAPTDDPAVATPAPVPIPPSFVTLTKRAWQKLVKNPDAYLGSGYRVWACITQFDAATGTGSFRGDASYRKLKYWYQGDNSFFAGDAGQLADYVAGDIVAMSVVDLGSYSYDTQAGGNTTVPLFQVVKIKREKGSCD